MKNTQAPAYYEVAKLVGEAQGIVFQGTTAGLLAAASSSVTQPGTSAASTSYARQYGSATYSDLAPGIPAASTSLPSPTYPGEYAVRPSQFGLTRSPGRAGNSSYGTSAAASSSTYYQPQPIRPYSNSPSMQYRSAVNGAAGSSSSSSPHILPSRPAGSSSSSHVLPQRPAGSKGYGAALNSQIPTSLPLPLPPKSAIAGQPAIPMNFKPSPFFNVISAVSTVVTLPSE